MNDEIAQVKERYKKRGHFTNALYDPLIPSVFKARQEKESALIRWINHAGLAPVNNKTVLEVGCGSGSNLLQLLTLGFLPENLFGIELLNDRAKAARYQLPDAVKIFEGDASDIVLPEKQFDVVLQSTVFTSILDKHFQQKLADRIWRMVKPGGGVLWFDFIYDNPKNPDVRGVPLKRVYELFPKGEFTVWRVVLAPPISRFVTRIHPCLYSVFNLFPLLRTHVICWIEKIEAIRAD